MTPVSEPLHKPERPAIEQLQQLYNSLPSMAKGVAEGKIGGKGVKAPKKHPTKICKVCFKSFEWKTGDAPGQEKIIVVESMRDPCPDCDRKLKEGYTALVAGNRYAFVKSAKFMDWAGQIIHISPQVMSSVQVQFNAEWNTAQEPTDAKENHSEPDREA